MICSYSISIFSSNPRFWEILAHWCYSVVVC